MEHRTTLDLLAMIAADHRDTARFYRGIAEEHPVIIAEEEEAPFRAVDYAEALETAADMLEQEVSRVQIRRQMVAGGDWQWADEVDGKVVPV